MDNQVSSENPEKARAFEVVSRVEVARSQGNAGCGSRRIEQQVHPVILLHEFINEKLNYDVF